MRTVITFRGAMPSDAQFVHECLEALRGRAVYSIEDLRQYLRRLSADPSAACAVLVACHGETPIGVLTTNRFGMPRYLGFGIELEEVVIHERYRRRGYGEAMLSSFLRAVECDPDVRAVRVRTDDHDGSGRLYGRLFTATDARLYGRSVNSL